MTENSGVSKVLWRAVLGLIGAALLSAIWAGFFAEGCASCGGAAASGGGRALARFGAVFYALLLGTGLVLGRSRAVWTGVMFAASVHAALLVTLAMRGEHCPPCLATGASAIGAAVLACLTEPFNLARASVMVPGAALATQGFVLALGLSHAPGPSGAAEGRPGPAKMVVYERPDCVYCVRLEEDVLPGLAREFGPRLEVERRSATEFPGMPTPTILLSGAGARRSFPGLPGSDVLRRAVLDCLGDVHDRPALLPASR
jgi:hypothetical protein